MRAVLASILALALVAAPSVAAPKPRAPGTTLAMPRGLSVLAPMTHSAFPYSGVIPEQDKPFLDVTGNGRRGHSSPRGGVLWEDEAYRDNRSLLFIPPRFNPGKPAALILFFHGNRATLERDVIERQGVPRQLVASGLNAVLVAPQMAIDALDSSAGHFYQPGFFDAYLGEAANRLASLSEGRLSQDALNSMPVIIVAYSGGYLPTAFSLAVSRTHRRIMGVILLDALFGESAKFESWILRAQGTGFFLSTYSKASISENEALKSGLDAEGFKTESGLPAHLTSGTVAFIAAPTAEHNDFVTHAWMDDPLAAMLKRIAITP